MFWDGGGWGEAPRGEAGKGREKKGGPGPSPGKFLENGPPNLSFWVVSRRMKQDQGLWSSGTNNELLTCNWGVPGSIPGRGP